MLSARNTKLSTLSGFRHDLFCHNISSTAEYSFSWHICSTYTIRNFLAIEQPDIDLTHISTIQVDTLQHEGEGVTNTG